MVTPNLRKYKGFKSLVPEIGKKIKSLFLIIHHNMTPSKISIICTKFSYIFRAFVDSLGSLELKLIVLMFYYN